MTGSDWSVPGYTPVRVLGEGAAGRVVLARHDAGGVPVAIKYLNPALREDPDFLARFRAEARLLGALRHPGVVRFYEYVEGADGAAIVMEAVDGLGLRTLLREYGPTGPEAALAVLRGSLLGLAAAHAAGVVHRDYKPENVLVRTDGSSTLADFGIAVRQGRETEVAGTPGYMAPEQWRGEPATPATDVYAATAVFFECLTGRRPFRADDTKALRLQHLRAPVPLDEAPEVLRGLLAAGLAKEAADRPAISDFLARIEDTAARCYGADWERRGRRRLGELAGLLALLLPFAAPVAEGGTALALTTLGRLLWVGRLAAAGLAALAVVVGGLAVTAPHPRETGSVTASSTPSPVLPPPATPSSSASPSASASPSPSPSASTSPSASASPSSSPSPSASVPVSASPSASPTPSPSAPPTPAGVSIVITSAHADLTQGSRMLVTVTVTTPSAATVVVGAEFFANTTATVIGTDTRQLAGGTHYQLTFVGDFANYPCGATWHVRVTSQPKPVGGGRGAAIVRPHC